MEIKILQVFYGKDGLPYKDKDRQVHFPITGTGFLGASNTTKIKFYYDELDNLDETSWVAVSKLPNGKVGSRVLESYLDEELNEHYALLELDNYYTQYKGDVFISLQGYQGGVDFDYDEENSQYEIHGTPTIAATGSIKFTINYANQFIGSGETDNINFQRILAALGTKLGMRAYSEHVEELPSEGSPDVFYVVNDDPNNPNLANIYVWNENTEHYIWVGDNTLDLGDYYTKEQGNQFESGIDNRVTSVENELSSVASGSPKGVYATLAALQAAYPTGDDSIYVVSADGHWYYWNGSAWTDGGEYLSVDNLTQTTNKLNDLGSLIGGNTILIAESLAESGTGVGANWNFYYNISLPKGTKVKFTFTEYTGSLLTNIIFRTKDSNNVSSVYSPVLYNEGDQAEYVLYNDCVQVWVQVNRSDTENGVTFAGAITFDTNGLYKDITDIKKELPINIQEVLRSDILKNVNARFKSNGVVESAGANSWCVSDFIPVGEGLTVTGYSYSTTRPAIVEYEADKSFIISVVATDGAGKYITKKYTPDMRVKYVRIQTIVDFAPNTSATRLIYTNPKVYRVEKDGSGDFTKLSDAINEACRYMDSTIYVGPGTYDLINELGVGSTYIVSSTNRGLVLKNRVKIIFSSNSKVTCNYEGNDTDTITWLSAFNAGKYGFTLVNATIESSKCRYSVHDERDSDADAYVNHYINCKMKHDNTNGGYNQCIGGGLGLNGYIVIEGCTFENPARTNYQIVYYHNSAGSGKSFVEVKGCYFKGTNTLGFQWYGTSTEISTLFAHDNSLGSQIQHTGVSGATIENTEVISFNNEIRGS